MVEVNKPIYIGALIAGNPTIEVGRELKVSVRRLPRCRRDVDVDGLMGEKFMARVPRAVQEIRDGIVVLKGGSQIPIDHLRDERRIVSVRIGGGDSHMPTVDISSLQREDKLPSTAEFLRFR